MTLIPTILYFGGFAIVMLGFFLSIKAKARQLKMVNKDAPTKAMQTKRRMTLLYQLYSDPQLDSSAYDHYNTLWVLSLFFWLTLIGACIASIYSIQVYQDVSFSMITSLLAILGLIILIIFSRLRTKAFYRLKHEALNRYPERQEILLYYPERTRLQSIAYTLVTIGLLGMLSTPIAIFFLI